MRPLISIAIIHYGQTAFLQQCIASVQESLWRHQQIVVVNNNPDPIPEELHNEIDTYIHCPENSGFAEGCNRAVEDCEAEYIFILNNDVTIAADSINRLYDAIENVPSVAIAQPCMHSLEQKDLFHSSAAGGMLDIFGYPFTRGRIYDHHELDSGQYKTPVRSLWCSGAALFVRKEAIVKAGRFDADFFLYMEEIDLQWRMQAMGYEIAYVPDALIYHQGSPNLDRGCYKRIYYSHRNSVMMLIKNLPLLLLLIILPVRLFMELGIMAISLCSGNVTRLRAICMALMSVTIRLPVLLSKRWSAQRLANSASQRDVVSRLYKGSVMIAFFARKKQTYRELIN